MLWDVGSYTIDHAGDPAEEQDSQEDKRRKRRRRDEDEDDDPYVVIAVSPTSLISQLMDAELDDMKRTNSEIVYTAMSVSKPEQYISLCTAV